MCGRLQFGIRWWPFHARIAFSRPLSRDNRIGLAAMKMSQIRDGPNPGSDMAFGRGPATLGRRDPASSALAFERSPQRCAPGCGSRFRALKALPQRYTCHIHPARRDRRSNRVWKAGPDLFTCLGVRARHLTAVSRSGKLFLKTRQRALPPPWYPNSEASSTVLWVLIAVRKVRSCQASRSTTFCAFHAALAGTRFRVEAPTSADAAREFLW